MKLILSLSLLAILIFGLLLLKSTVQNPYEQALAKEHDGTDSFYKQVLKSNGGWVENTGKPIFDNQLLAIDPPKLRDNNLAQVLGSHIAADGSEKWIEVDLSDLRLYAWEGNRKVYEFSISTGRPGYETPAGEYRVWRKVRTQAYRGGSKVRGDYYYLPNVPYSLFFGGSGVPNSKGYAIHGAYWHNDFGIKNRSSGCVNVKPEEAGLLYNWAGPAMSDGLGVINATADNPGVRVVVHD